MGLDRLSDFVTLSISVFVESLPFVFLGILLSIAVQVWLPPTLLDRVLPRRPALRRAALSLLGVLLPVCECGNVPLARGLIMRGFSPAEAMTFLLAAPILNPVTIVTTYQAFGWDHGILVARLAGGFVIANLVGWVFSRHPAQRDLLTERFERACRHDHGGSRLAAGGIGAGAGEGRAPDAGGGSARRERLSPGRLARSASHFAEETGAMLPALVVGSGIAGAVQVGVPRDALFALGSHPLWSVVALLALAFIVSICSNVDAFFMLSLGSTFMPGGIVAFLVFGAMMDIKMFALLRTTFTTRALLRVLALCALCALALGWGVNLVA